MPHQTILIFLIGLRKAFPTEPFKSLLQECIDHSEAKCRLKARTVNPYVFVCILAGSEVWEQGGARNELWLWSTAAFSWVSDVRYGDSCQCEYARDRGLCKTPSNTSWLAFTWRASQKDNLTVHTDAHELPFSFWALRSSHLKKMWFRSGCLQICSLRLGKMTFCTLDLNYDPLDMS